MAWYIGFKHDDNIVDIFFYEGTPTKKEFGSVFTNVGGPFKSKITAQRYATKSGYKLSYSDKQLLEKEKQKKLIVKRSKVLEKLTKKYSTKKKKNPVKNVKAILKQFKNVKYKQKWGNGYQIYMLGERSNYGGKEYLNNIKMLKKYFIFKDIGIGAYPLQNDKMMYTKYIEEKQELKKNPPTATEIYDNILAIEAVKGTKSLWPKEKFRHDFKRGGKIIGLSDGSLLIKPKKDGKTLWKNFNY